MTKTLKKSETFLTDSLLADAIRTLEKHFGPRVQHLAPTRIETTVEYVEAMPQVSGHRFALIVHHAPELTFDKIRELLDHLEIFTHYEGERLFYAGYDWALGDGDDLGAVYMSHGKLCIWLRGWKHGTMFA